MRSLALFAALLLVAPAGFVPLKAADPDRDFSGRWVLDSGAAAAPNERLLTVVQNQSTIRCYSSRSDGSQIEWSYALNGDESRYTVGEESRNSVAKWEGEALLIHTLVSGPQSYTIMDRWRLSPDHSSLTITRQVVRASGQDESTLVYYREGHTPPPPESRPLLVKRQPAPAPAAATADEYVVPNGTHILLSLRNALDTKHSKDGDRVYLETVYPVSAGGRIVIPRGSFVTGVVSQAKQAGTVKGKGELYIRFDSLTLPNGVTRNFLSRLSNADTPNGKVDRDEGKITGERDRTHDAKTTAEGAGIGATIGGVAGGAAGAPLKGVGIGAAAGAAAGLAGALSRHKPDATLPRGTTVEMVLDRDLRYQRAELFR
jgi:type IV secretion system protein VirB10